jgi:pyruvate,water dikinase
VSSGTVTGPVAHAGSEIPAGSVLVVSHLDPRLAAAIPRLGGLVAETGNALSHLAILAREYGVPAIVGVADATQRFSEGQVLAIDGDTGTVQTVAQPEPIVAGDPALLSRGAAS